MASAIEKLWPSHVDPAMGLPAGERKAIHKGAWKRWQSRRSNYIVYTIYGLAGIALVSTFRDSAGWLATQIGVGGWTWKLVRITAMAVWFGAWFVLGGAMLQRWRFAPCVWAELRSRGHDVCPHCGYWLRGLEDGDGGSDLRCPECGVAIDREPAQEDARDGA